jgi:F1F0 ATPase subunit 2
MHPGVEKDSRTVSAPLLLTVLTYAVVGLAAGLAYFAVLRVNVRLYVDGSSSWCPLILHGVRIAVAVGLFWILAIQGAAPMLAGLAGFVTARFVALRWKERQL